MSVKTHNAPQKKLHFFQPFYGFSYHYIKFGLTQSAATPLNWQQSQ